MRIGCMLLLCNLTVDSVVGEILPITEQVKKETELRGRVTDAATGEVIKKHGRLSQSHRSWILICMRMLWNWKKQW